MENNEIEYCSFVTSPKPYNNDELTYIFVRILCDMIFVVQITLVTMIFTIGIPQIQLNV